MNKRIWLYVSCILCYSCNQQQPTVGTDNEFPLLTIQWSPDSASSLNDLIRTTECVALENTPEAAFASIDRIVCHNGQYYIFDKYGSNKLLIFNADGKFIRVIGRKGRGPGEYVQLESFSIKKDTIFLLDPNGQKILMYDTSGLFLDEQKIETKDMDEVAWLSDGFLFYKALYQDEPIQANTSAIFRSDRNGRKIDAYYDYDESSPRVSFEPTLTESDSCILFSPYFNDTVFVFDRYGIIKQGIYFDFGERTIARNLRSQVKKVQENKAQYRFLSSALIPVGSGLFGTISDCGSRTVFAIGRNNGHIYIDPDGSVIPALPSNIAAKDSTAIISWLSYDVKDNFSRSLGEKQLTEMLPRLENGQVFLVVYHLQ